ncbi:unnamed protein product [Colias eurytheme]|nr:unnamed protein product [Colias eurytheme]
MPPKKRFITCEICGDRASRSGGEKRMFMAKFPGDEARCRQWVKYVGKEDLIYVPIEKLHTLKYVCDPLPDAMLLEFPYHINSNTDVKKESEKKNDNEAILSQIEPIDNSELNMPSQQLVAQGLSNLSRKRKRSPSSETSSSGQQHLIDHDYCIQKEVLQSYKEKKISGSDLEVTPRKRKLIKRVHLLKRKIKFLREGNIMPRIKSLALKTLIKAYIRNHGRKPQGKRWTPLEKALAIAIYKKSPRVFRHLQHLMELPSIRTLQSLLQSIELEPGISQTIMDHLKKKTAKLNEKDRVCALLFDEIALKKRLIFNSRTDKVVGFVDLGENQYRSSEIADHALVFMLQGLHKKLKQPIAYYFVKGTISSQSLAVLIKDIIKAVNDSGFTVITTVCDQGPTNIGSLNLLKEWCGNPATSNYFMVDDEKIFIMFDIPHLFKSLRNNFHSGGVIEYDGKKGQWSHLQQAAEKNTSTLHFQKLTALHVNPTFKSKMKVKLAAQALSNTVAAILKLMAEKYGGDDVKSQEVLETAQIVEDLDRLFDCTNGPSSKKDIKKHQRENVSKKSNHVGLWRHFKKIMSKLHFKKKDSFLRLKNVRCTQGYVTSLSSLEDIWKYVDSKGFKYLNLRQLNQDSLENLFGMIRQHCPTNHFPTCYHFTAALKSNILTNLSTPVGKGTNCEVDENEAIIDFEDFFQHVEKNEAIQVENYSPVVVLQEKDLQLPESANASVLQIPENPHFPDDHLDFLEINDVELLEIENRLFESFEKQPTVYVAGYLASVVLKKIRWQCEKCTLSLKIENLEQCDTPIYSYIKLREWWQDKKSLTYPTINLCKLVESATSLFEAQVKPILHERHISQQAVTMILSKCDNLLWICNDHKDRLLHLLLVRLCHLLIRNECNRTNLSFAKAEESIADTVKKAQQQGIAKS